MKKMKSFSFRYKNANNETQYDNIVANNFQEALTALYGDNLPDIDNVYTSEVNVLINE